MDIGWDVGAGVFAAWVWLAIRSMSGAETRAHSTAEDGSRFVAHALLLAASTVSIASDGVVLLKARQSIGFERAELTVLAIATVAISWLVVQLVYTLRYAHEYYVEPVGGINFEDSNDTPDYQDFAYVAFTIGMTFQISDTTVERSSIRRTVLRHALLAYFYGAVILAVTVNVIASIGQ